MQLNLPRGTIFLAAAVVAGLVATFGIHRYVSVKTRVVEAPTRQVFIATADISPGTALSGTAVKAVTWPQAVIPPNCASSMRELENRVVKVPIPQGNPVLFSMLAPVGTAAGLSGILDDGKRALTVKVDEVAGVAGFVHPGDHVDVLMDMAMKGATGALFQDHPARYYDSDHRADLGAKGRQQTDGGEYRHPGIDPGTRPRCSIWPATTARSGWRSETATIRLSPKLRA